MHYLILVLGECWLVLWQTTVLFLGDLGEVQCLGSSLDPLENMWEMILWCLLYQQSSSVSPSPCHLSCSLHSLDYSRWESERQEGVWEVFFFFFFKSACLIPPIQNIQGTKNRVCFRWPGLQLPLLRSFFIPWGLPHISSTPSRSLEPEWWSSPIALW